MQDGNQQTRAVLHAKIDVVFPDGLPAVQLSASTFADIAVSMSDGRRVPRLEADDVVS